MKSSRAVVPGMFRRLVYDPVNWLAYHLTSTSLQEGCP